MVSTCTWVKNCICCIFSFAFFLILTSPPNRHSASSIMSPNKLVIVSVKRIKTRRHSSLSIAPTNFPGIIFQKNNYIHLFLVVFSLSFKCIILISVPFCLLNVYFSTKFRRCTNYTDSIDLAFPCFLRNKRNLFSFNLTLRSHASAVQIKLNSSPLSSKITASHPLAVNTIITHPVNFVV